MDQIKQLKMEILTSIRYNPGSLEDLMSRYFIKGKYAAESIDRLLFLLESDGFIRYSFMKEVYKTTAKGKREVDGV